ncbi:MAG: extracellular solute-binding protein [Caldilineaceae bacterium]|nr:extracellular solute-binding protein [Caldilineaceae bacterium]
MNENLHSSHLSRRDLLKAMGLTTTALVAGSALAACAPAAAPGGSGAPAAEAGGAKLQLWTFVNTHARWYQSMAEDYKKEVNPDFELTVTEIAYADMHDKLQIALQTGGVGAPDISDIEQGRFGGFLRGADPGLVDLKDRLTEGGYLEQLVAAREALYSYQGHIYGIEHALTPVVLYYRADVWEGAGVDLEAIQTWEEYIEAAKGVVSADVKALAFPAHDLILRQRNGDYFDAEGNVTLDSALSVETMEWILALRDTHGIAVQAPATGDEWWAAVKDGKFLSHVGADWYAGFFKDNAPDLTGLWKAIPLPAWETGGIRTSCHGGTGSCIVKTSPNAEEAWKFLEYSMLSIEGNVRRFEMTNLFPPFIPAMDNERLHAPDEYFSGQDLGALFAQVGPEVPAQYQSPYRAELNAQLNPRQQELLDGQVAPADVYSEVAEAIRTVIAEEAA